MDSLSYGAVTNLSVTELYRSLPLTHALFHCILSFSFYVVSFIQHHVIMASSAVLRFRSFLYPIRWNINPKPSHICPLHSPAQSLAYMTYKNYPLILFTRPQTGFHSNRSELRNDSIKICATVNFVALSIVQGYFKWVHQAQPHVHTYSVRPLVHPWYHFKISSSCFLSLSSIRFRKSLV